jgi:hypothetical protein
MKPMALKYMFRFLSRSTLFALATSAGFGALGSEPSVTTSAGLVMAGEN